MANSSQYGAFVPTNYIWDIQQLQETNIDPQAKELLIRLYQNVNAIALVLNVKTTGQFPLMETVNGNLWFPNPNNNSTTAATASLRQELQQTYLITNVVPGVRTVAHGITITKATTFTGLDGAASDQVGFKYYGFNSGAGAANISAVANSTNIVITNNTGITFTTVYIVFKYLQN